MRDLMGGAIVGAIGCLIGLVIWAVTGFFYAFLIVPLVLGTIVLARRKDRQ